LHRIVGKDTSHCAADIVGCGYDMFRRPSEPSDAEARRRLNRDYEHDPHAACTPWRVATQLQLPTTRRLPVGAAERALLQLHLLPHCRPQLLLSAMPNLIQ